MLGIVRKASRWVFVKEGKGIIDQPKENHAPDDLNFASGILKNIMELGKFGFEDVVRI
jgi:hypothetical protein